MPNADRNPIEAQGPTIAPATQAKGEPADRHGEEQQIADTAASWSKLWSLYRERGIGSAVGFGSRPAILVVDMTKAFTNPFHRVGAEMTTTVEAIARLLAVARRHQVRIFFTTLAFEQDEQDSGVWGEKIPALRDLLLSDPAAVQIDERIAPMPGETIINKKRPSAFFGTPLLPLLIAARIDTIILTGCSTSGCIRATAIDAVSYGFRVILPEECVADRAKEPHYANLFDIQAKYGDVVSLEKVTKYLSSLPVA
jgi:maleamate amidohydrolase